MKKEMAAKNKEFEDRLSKQAKDHEKELLKQAKKYEEQLKSKKKEVEELRQAKEQLEKELAEYKKRQSSAEGQANESVKSIQILDLKSIKELDTIEEIGVGASGKVVKVAKKKFYALKIMISYNQNIENFKHFMSEYEIMNLLNHPNILKTLGIFLSDQTNPPAILLEYCPSNLNMAIKNGSILKVQIPFIIYQIAEGMRYIHFKKIIHRDLKPANILIAEDETIKISDFGISKMMTQEELTAMTIGVGTNRFMAPEIISEDEYYDEKVDVYSFGVLVFFIISGGQLPQIRNGEVMKGKKAKIPDDFTEFAKNLINSCWNFDPKDRPSFDSICKQMEQNEYNLYPLTLSEKKDVISLVQNHKMKIPNY